MKSGDVVVVNAAGEYSMYASDITRTPPVNGHYTDRQREIYNIVLGAQRAAEAAFVAGKSRENDPSHKYADSLDTIAWKYMNEHGKDLHGEPLGKYFIHGIGHLVGSTCMTLTTTQSHLKRTWSSPSSLESISRKRRSASASKTSTMPTLMAN